MSECQNSKVGRCFWSNETIGRVIEHFVNDMAVKDVAELFDMTEYDVIKIIRNNYKPVLSGDLMSITIPSKLI